MIFWLPSLFAPLHYSSHLFFLLSLCNASAHQKAQWEQLRHIRFVLTLEHPVRFEPRNVSKRMLHMLGHPVGHLTGMSTP